MFKNGGSMRFIFVASFLMTFQVFAADVSQEKTIRKPSNTSVYYCDSFAHGEVNVFGRYSTPFDQTLQKVQEEMSEHCDPSKPFQLSTEKNFTFCCVSK